MHQHTPASLFRIKLKCSFTLKSDHINRVLSLEKDLLCLSRSPLVGSSAEKSSLPSTLISQTERHQKRRVDLALSYAPSVIYLSPTGYCSLIAKVARGHNLSFSTIITIGDKLIQCHYQSIVSICQSFQGKKGRLSTFNAGITREKTYESLMLPPVLPPWCSAKVWWFYYTDLRVDSLQTVTSTGCS